MDRETLRADLEIVTRARAPAKDDSLSQALRRLDAAARSALPRDLVHYLRKRSYLKALAWLDDPKLSHHP